MTTGARSPPRETKRVSAEETRLRLHSFRKLALVLDLDQTLVHATSDPAAEPFVKRNKEDPTVHIYRPQRGHTHYVKIRSGLDDFLAALDPMFEFHIYTAATRSYAEFIATAVDPKRVYFKEIVAASSDDVHRPMAPVAGIKNLVNVPGLPDRMAVVVDDVEEAWGPIPNLIVIHPYRFFKGLRKLNPAVLSHARAMEVVDQTLARWQSLKSAIRDCDAAAGRKDAALSRSTSPAALGSLRSPALAVPVRRASPPLSSGQRSPTRRSPALATTTPPASPGLRSVARATGLPTDGATSRSPMHRRASPTGRVTPPPAALSSTAATTATTATTTTTTTATSTTTRSSSPTDQQAHRRRSPDGRRTENLLATHAHEIDTAAQNGVAKMHISRTNGGDHSPGSAMELEAVPPQRHDGAERVSVRNGSAAVLPVVVVDDLELEEGEIVEDPPPVSSQLVSLGSSSKDPAHANCAKLDAVVLDSDLPTITPSADLDVAEDVLSRAQETGEEVAGKPKDDDGWSDDEECVFMGADAKEEKEELATLTSLRVVLTELHKRYYRALDSSRSRGESSWNPDVTDILSGLKAGVLAGTVIAFSGVISKDKKPSESTIWRRAVQHGARCVDAFGPDVTHLVANKRTPKVDAALTASRVFIVHVRWLHASIRFWHRQAEAAYPVETGLPTVGTGPKRTRTSDGVKSETNGKRKREGSSDDGERPRKTPKVQ